MPKSDGFTVRVEPIEDGFILYPHGDVDLSCSPVLRSELAEALRQAPTRLIVDLSEVPYMDSSGVATLLEAMQMARKRRARLVLCGVRDKVKAIFQIARLESVFSIVENADAAKSA